MPENSLTTFHERVVAARLAAGHETTAEGYRALTRHNHPAGLANEDAYYKIERGDRLPKLPAVQRIATTYGVSLDWLVNGELRLPREYVAWRESSPRARAASPQHLAIVDRMPLEALERDGALYSLLLTAVEEHRLAPDAAIQSARETVADMRESSVANAKGGS